MLFHISTVVLNPPWTTIFEANTSWKWKKRVCAFRFFFWVHSHFGVVGFFFFSGFDLHFSHYFIMKLSGFWVLFFVLQTTLLLLFFPSYINASSSSDIALKHHHVNANKCLSDIPLNRKLKFQTDEHYSLGRKKVHPGDLNLDDYHPIDPVPSSKTSVKPGPIEHGTPLLPHMPNPPPPNQPGDYA